MKYHQHILFVSVDLTSMFQRRKQESHMAAMFVFDRNEVSNVSKLYKRTNMDVTCQIRFFRPSGFREYKKVKSQ